MTSLAHDTNRPQSTPAQSTPAQNAPANFPGIDLADKVGIAVAVICAVLAIVLAVTEVIGEGASASNLPSLTPLAEGSYWTGFSA